MDDGSRQGDGLHINVYGFSDEDVDKFMFTLQDKFNLKCSIHYNRDKKPRIYIFKESMDNLRSLTSPFFLLKKCYINWVYKAVTYILAITKHHFVIPFCMLIFLLIFYLSMLY